VYISQGDLTKTSMYLDKVGKNRINLGPNFLDEGQDIMMEEAQMHTPGGSSGELRRGWHRGWTSKSAYIYNETPYLRAVDEGTQQYIIEPRTRRALFAPGWRRPVARVRHPGIKAQHFIRRIYSNSRRRAIQLANQMVTDMVGRY
jgi:hypothetical protein